MSSKSKKNTQKPQAQDRKSGVVISDVSYVALLDASPKESWYTHEETERMKVEMFTEAIRHSRLMTNSPGSFFTKENQLKCVGIECYIIPAIAEQARQDRRRHKNLVLRAQQVYTEKDLSILSSKSSASARQRAYLIANRI
jgi:hypothetical protein